MNWNLTTTQTNFLRTLHITYTILVQVQAVFSLLWLLPVDPEFHLPVDVDPRFHLMVNQMRAWSAVDLSVKQCDYNKAQDITLKNLRKFT